MWYILGAMLAILFSYASFRNYTYLITRMPDSLHNALCGLASFIHCFVYAIAAVVLAFKGFGWI